MILASERPPNSFPARLSFKVFGGLLISSVVYDLPILSGDPRIYITWSRWGSFSVKLMMVSFELGPRTEFARSTGLIRKQGSNLLIDYGFFFTISFFIFVS